MKTRATDVCMIKNPKQVRKKLPQQKFLFQPQVTWNKYCRTATSRLCNMNGAFAGLWPALQKVTQTACKEILLRDITLNKQDCSSSPTSGLIS